MKRGRLAAIPFVLSLGLSLSAIGSHAYWQDSGIFLSAVKDAGILYPPGFVLYVALAKLWTLVLSFLDFTLAVHLFSAACTAATASVITLAARDFLGSRSGFFRAWDADAPAVLDGSAIAAGCLAASGFTFWFSGVYAKGYALYYLVLALLLWAIIRSDAERSPASFRRLALLIGLAWAAHPSSVCLAPPLLVHLWRWRASIGGKEFVRGIGIAAAAALGPSVVLLPLLAAREPVTALGDPRSLSELADYVLGLRFMGRPGAFGFESARAATFGLFLWEEFLGSGLLALVLGMTFLVGVNGRLLLWILSWALPYSLLAVLFKVEGQHDHWFVAAWMPLHLLAGLGLLRAASWAPAGIRPAIPGMIAALGLAWSVSANHADVKQRGYDLAEQYGRILLEPADREAILVLNGDDALALTGYLQRVRGLRADVTVVAQPFLGQSFVSERDWYDQKLLRERPFLRMPDYAGARAAFPESRPLACHLAAFIAANAGRGRELFTQASLPPSMLPPGAVLVPAGALWKVVPARAPGVELRYWRFPVDLEHVQHRMGRERGLKLVRRGASLEPRQESYERRLVDLLLRSRVGLGEALLRAGKGAEAWSLLDSVRKVDEDQAGNPMFASLLGQAFVATGRGAQGEELLRASLTQGLPPGPRGWALLALSEAAAARGAQDEANARRAEAAASAGGDPLLVERLKATERSPKPLPK